MVVWYLMPGGYHSQSYDRIRSAVSEMNLPPSGLMVNIQNAFNLEILPLEEGNFFHSLRIAYQISLLLKFFLEIKVRKIDPSNADECKALASEVIPASGKAAAKNMILHLLFPETFEAIADNKNKQAIVRAFQVRVSGTRDLDVALSQIRSSLVDEVGRQDFSFYDDDVRRLWRPGSSTGVPGDNGQKAPDLPLQDVAQLSYMDLTNIKEIEELINFKKQIVFEGPPGSGKTFLADLFARHFTGNPLEGPHDEQIEIVQFHQSYGYEDFVQGIRPVTDEEGRLQYRVMPGIFLQLCERAKANPDKPFVLIIDEINRGNLSRIFGELLMLLEYREKRVRLPYAAGDGNSDLTYIEIPSNLYLIGTMNSTDRSLAMIDYALRRRFFFYRLLPLVDGRAPVLERWLASKQDFGEADRRRVLTYFIKINERVSEQLSADFQIGHSYFMVDDIVEASGLGRVWRHALRPLLEEYFHTARGLEQIVAELAPEFGRLSGSPSEAPDDRAVLSADDV